MQEYSADDVTFRIKNRFLIDCTSILCYNNTCFFDD